MPARLFECSFAAAFLGWTITRAFSWRDWLTGEGFHLTEDELLSMGYPSPWQPMSPFQAWLFMTVVATGVLMLLAPVAEGVPVRFWTRHRRKAGLWTLAFCALLFQKVDFMAAFTLNKLYIGGFFLLALSPGMRFCRNTGKLVLPVITIRVLQWTLVLQYFAAGLAKMEGDWLRSNDVLWEHVQGVYRTSVAAWALQHMPRWVWSALQHLSLAFEVLAPLLFSIRFLRPAGIFIGICFHLMIALMMKDLIFFSAQMWTFYLLFVTSEQLRWARAWFQKSSC